MADITSFGLGAALSTFIGYVTEIYNKFKSIFFITVTIPNSYIIKKKLVDDYKIPFFEKQMFSTYSLYNEGKQVYLYAQLIPDNCLLLHNKSYLKSVYFSKGEYNVKFTFIRGMYDKHYFINLIIDEVENSRKNQNNNDVVADYECFVYEYPENNSKGNSLRDINSNNTEQPSNEEVHNEGIAQTYVDKKYDINKLSYSNIKPNTYEYILSKELKSIEQEIETWLKLRSWYTEKQITWKRGYLLYGEPGNGKSSFVKHISYRYGMDVYKINLSLMTNSDMLSLFDMLSKRNNCIVLIEDIDSVFDKRTNINSSLHLDSITNQPVSFDVFLNCLDGIKQVRGILLFITTNDIDKVDDALKNRPSRIDKCVFIDNPTYEIKLEMATRLFDEFPEQIDIILQDTDNYSTSMFKEKCINKLLELKWN
jgi:hypothetical protein